MSHELAIPFSLRGVTGHIAVTVEDHLGANPYEVLLGALASDVPEGFPICTAEIEYPRDCYAAMFGWTQMVKASDSASPQDFDVDPIALYRNLQTPYCWFGLKPTLFDAPWRFHPKDMTWVCHSYLCFTPNAVLSPHVRAIAGFEWDFDVMRGAVIVHEPAILSEDAWNDRVPLLQQSYPGWTFDSGFRDC